MRHCSETRWQENCRLPSGKNLHWSSQTEQQKTVRPRVDKGVIKRVFLRLCSLSYLVIPDRSRNNQSSHTEFVRVNSPSGFTRISILHENIHATRVVTLFEEGLGTMSKNSSRGINLEIIKCHTLHSLLVGPNHSRSSKLFLNIKCGSHLENKNNTDWPGFRLIFWVSLENFPSLSDTHMVMTPGLPEIVASLLNTNSVPFKVKCPMKTAVLPLPRKKEGRKRWFKMLYTRVKKAVIKLIATHWYKTHYWILYLTLDNAI